MADEPKPQYSTPEQLAAYEKQAEALLTEWHDKLSPLEFEVWCGAFIEDCEAKVRDGELEIQWNIELLDILKKYEGFDEAYEAIKKINQKTAAEFNFLRVMNHIKRSGLMK